MNGYYSVFNPRGEKIADCGIERDAVNLMSMRNRRWDGHYFTFNPLPGDIVDVSQNKQLPTTDIVVNMDGGVGGSWFEVKAKDYLCNNKNHLFLIFMTKSIDFKRYEKFVDAVTSDESTDFLALSDRLVELDRKGANIERLLTAGVGINAEGGEFLEIVKKMIFQGKPFDAHNKEHMIIELGDLMWYVAQACMALEIDFEDVIARNVQKLEKRYPGGKFDIYYSENRAEDDL